MLFPTGNWEGDLDFYKAIVRLVRKPYTEAANLNKLLNLKEGVKRVRCLY